MNENKPFESLDEIQAYFEAIDREDYMTREQRKDFDFRVKQALFGGVDCGAISFSELVKTLGQNP